MDEKKWVEIMFTLYSIQWMLATGVNFLLATDPTLVGQYSIHIFDFVIGSSLGVFAVQMIEYMRGLIFVES